MNENTITLSSGNKSRWGYIRIHIWFHWPEVIGSERRMLPNMWSCWNKRCLGLSLVSTKLSDEIFFLRYHKMNLWSLKLFVSMREELWRACRVWGKGQSEGGKTERKKQTPTILPKSWSQHLPLDMLITWTGTFLCCFSWLKWDNMWLTTLYYMNFLYQKKIAIISQLLFTFSHLKVSKTLRNQVFWSVKFVVCLICLLIHNRDHLSPLPIAFRSEPLA